MRVTGTLYVTDHRAKIRLRKGTIIVEQASGWERVPIESLDGVVLTGRADITNSAIGELVRRGVRIAALSRTGRLRFAVGGPVGGNVHLRIAQVSRALDEGTAAKVARWVVAGKLQNCRRAILRWARDATGTSRWVMEREVQVLADRINGLGASRDGDRIRGIEGDGARRYFRCLGLHLESAGAPVGFGNRTRRPPRDPVNALLSFVYGILVAELIGSLDAVGLDPQIGFLHRPRSGRPSLALDLLEELRPAIADRFVVRILMRRQVRLEHFETVAGAYYLSDNARPMVLELYEEFRNAEVPHEIVGRRVGRWAVPTVQSTLMARYLRGDLPAYPPFADVA